MKKQLIAIILILCMALLFSCEAKKNDVLPSDTAYSASVQAAETPTPSDMPEPEEKLAKAFPIYKEKYAELIDEYTLSLPSYEPIDRETPPHVSKMKNTRFKLYESGWYKNPGAEDSGEAVLMFTGDLMCQGRQQEAALERYGEYNFNKSFKAVKQIFESADLSIGNLETTLCAKAPYMSEENRVDDKPHCNAPATYLNALRYAGFDGVVMANNHNCDTGVYGILDTIDNVNDYKLMHTGTFADKAEKRYLLIEVNGIRIALMSYATYFNTKDAHISDEGQSIMLNRYSRQIVARDVQDAKADGAEFIIAYNHWGTEYTNEESEKQRTYAQEMANAGVDYIIGSHPHALQRYDVLTAADGRNVPVVYSMGNFMTHMRDDITKDTIILQLTLKRTEDGIAFEDGYIPCRVFKELSDVDYCVVPMTDEYIGSHRSKEFMPAYERITAVMGDKIEVIGGTDVIFGR